METPESPSLQLIHELFRYHYWARDRQLKACESLTEEQFRRPLGSSFSSIRDTLAHLIAAEWLWLEYWRGRSIESMWSPEQFPTLAAVAERWRKVEFEMLEYLGALNEEALARNVTLVDPQGRAWTYLMWRMMLHLINHQSYHRGQVATLLRQLGIQPPDVDFLSGHDVGFGVLR